MCSILALLPEIFDICFDGLETKLISVAWLMKMDAVLKLPKPFLQTTVLQSTQDADLHSAARGNLITRILNFMMDKKNFNTPKLMSSSFICTLTISRRVNKLTD